MTVSYVILLISHHATGYCEAIVHSETEWIKSTTHIQLSKISSHQTIFISIKYGVVDYIKVT